MCIFVCVCVTGKGEENDKEEGEIMEGRRKGRKD